MIRRPKKAALIWPVALAFTALGPGPTLAENHCQAGKLAASDGYGGDRFGSAIAMDGNRAIIGAAPYVCSLQAGSGAAFAYQFDGQGWVEETRLAAPELPELST